MGAWKWLRCEAKWGGNGRNGRGSMGERSGVGIGGMESGREEEAERERGGREWGRTIIEKAMRTLRSSRVW